MDGNGDGDRAVGCRMSPCVCVLCVCVLCVLCELCWTPTSATVSLAKEDMVLRCFLRANTVPPQWRHFCSMKIKFVLTSCNGRRNHKPRFRNITLHKTSFCCRTCSHVIIHMFLSCLVFPSLVLSSSVSSCLRARLFTCGQGLTFTSLRVFV